jgi:hypothetical protein
MMATFELYRYQLLPASRAPQQDLFGASLSLDELVARKNDILRDVLIAVYPVPDPDLAQKVVLGEHDWFVLKLAPRRKAKLNKPDFRIENVEDWPHVVMFVNNDPEVQVIGVSRNQRAFSNPFSVVRGLEKLIAKHLLKRGLTIQFHSIYDQSEFWSFVAAHQGKVEKVRFEMISPNMANISRVLQVDLKRLNKEANAQKTTLELESVPGTALEISEQDSMIASCVQYSADGGGDIKVKVKGFKKTISTSHSVRVIEIDEMVFENSTPDQLELILKGALK